MVFALKSDYIRLRDLIFRHKFSSHIKLIKGFPSKTTLRLIRFLLCYDFVEKSNRESRVDTRLSIRADKRRAVASGHGVTNITNNCWVDNKNITFYYYSFLLRNCNHINATIPLFFSESHIRSDIRRPKSLLFHQKWFKPLRKRFCDQTLRRIRTITQ